MAGPGHAVAEVGAEATMAQLKSKLPTDLMTTVPKSLTILAMKLFDHIWNMVLLFGIVSQIQEVVKIDTW